MKKLISKKKKKKNLIPQGNKFASSPCSSPYGRCQLKDAEEKRQSKVQHQRNLKWEALNKTVDRQSRDARIASVKALIYIDVRRKTY